jgi:hypothetical protein
MKLFASNTYFMKGLLCSSTVLAIALAPSIALSGGTDSLNKNSNKYSIKSPAGTPDKSQFSSDFMNAVYEGKPYLDMRYRYEFADDGAKTKNANASTLRTKLGYKSGAFYNTKLGIEVENVLLLSADDYYNSGVNNKTQYPLVRDPETTELNQLYLDFGQLADTSIKVGRQNIHLDNERFVGDSSWSQNDQVYDGIAITNTSLTNVTSFYSYITQINRSLGNNSSQGDWASDIHLFNVKYDIDPLFVPVAYAYLMNITDSDDNSNKTFGGNVSGEADFYWNTKLNYFAEYAKQYDYADNPNSYDADYYNFTGGLDIFGFNLKAGYDVIGSDTGTVGTTFKFPIGTRHSYNGWSDFDSVTPLAKGLKDINFGAGYAPDLPYDILSDVKLQALYHMYSEQKGGADIGDEINVQAKKTIMDAYNVTVKYADFKAESGTTYSDLQKFWLVLGAKF